MFWPIFFGNFRNLVFFCFFFHVLFFVLECSGVVCWGDVNNFGGDVYLNCLKGLVNKPLYRSWKLDRYRLHDYIFNANVR